MSIVQNMVLTEVIYIYIYIYTHTYSYTHLVRNIFM
jgi:hypothetical protein